MRNPELILLRREHQKALRKWKITRSPKAWTALRDITTAIIKVSAPRSERGAGV